MSRSYQLYIDGKFAPAADGATFESVNPHDGTVVATCARAGRKDAERAVEAARRAFDSGPWPRMSGTERAAKLKSISDKINQNKEALERLEIDDSGSTFRKVKERLFFTLWR